MIDNQSSMTDRELFNAFLKAMGGEWVVDRYSVDDNGKLRVHYVSVDDPRIVWTHNPHNPLSTIPKIGEKGMIGFIGQSTIKEILSKE